MNEEDSVENRGSIVEGLMICWGLNVLEIVVGISLMGGGKWIAPLEIAMLAASGLFQLLYVIPLCLSLKKSGKTQTAQGVVIAASITALLNAACWLTG